MGSSRWFRSPHHLLSLFLAVTLLLATGLTWLGWRMFDQDRALEGQRIQERLAQAAGLVAANLLPGLTGLEQRLSALSALPDSILSREAAQDARPLGGDALIAVFRTEDAGAYPASQLLYYPVLPRAPNAPPQIFAAPEVLEFHEKDYAKATDSYRRLARSRDHLISARALVGLARVLRKMHQPDMALAAYNELATLDPTPVGGLPAGLVARAARCEVLSELGQNSELEREAQALNHDLGSGRWKLSRASFLFYEHEIGPWLGPSMRSPSGEHVPRGAALALSAATDTLWEEWQRIRQGETPPAGRRSVWLNDQSVLLLWTSTPQRMVALVAGSGYFANRWRGTLETLERQGIRISLADTEGHFVLGQGAPGSAPEVTLPASDTQLPWTLRVQSANPSADLAQLASRRRLLLAGLGLVAFVVLVGSYVIARAVSRELEVARVQSDFVAAVSHEFRTPLASLLQRSELLADGRVPPGPKLQEYYQDLLRASERLGRLVEGLLDFGRMEAGGREYRFERIETRKWVQSVAEEFGREADQRGYETQTTLPEELPAVRGDREALGRALWNILDNAVKYSPDCKTIWVEAAAKHGQVAIAVRDRGLGIAPNEQKRVFKKFVRTSSARQAGVKGTGLGLAMVEHIARAHGGRAKVQSEPCKGSTFTILLPAAKL